MTPLDMVVGKLQAAGCDPTPKGPGAYESRCPAHDGKRKNLSISVGENRRVLLHCHHVGDNGSPSCRADAIVGALGLRLEDLFPPKSNGTVLGKIAAGLGASEFRVFGIAVNSYATSRIGRLSNHNIEK